MTIGDLKDLSFSDISDGLLDKHWVSLKLSAHVPCELMGDVRIEHFTKLTKENWEKAAKE